jgi:hypothetical protein
MFYCLLSNYRNSLLIGSCDERAADAQIGVRAGLLLGRKSGDAGPRSEELVDRYAAVMICIDVLETFCCARKRFSELLAGETVVVGIEVVHARREALLDHGRQRTRGPGCYRCG